MEQEAYTVDVRYSITNKSGNIIDAVRTFSIVAKSEQYVKYFYHKYTHENYKHVDRTLEDLHVHPVNSGTVEHNIENITTEEPDNPENVEHLRFV